MILQCAFNIFATVSTFTLLNPYSIDCVVRLQFGKKSVLFEELELLTMSTSPVMSF